MKTSTIPTLIQLILIGLFFNTNMYAQFGKPDYEKTSMERAALDYECSKEEISVARSAKYTGGALVVLKVCESTAYYECMGTVCQQRCKYVPKASDYSGNGEAGGKFHKQVFERASVEFELPQTEIKQVKHHDDTGQGVYYLSVKRNEVIYECAGTVCNLKCE